MNRLFGLQHRGVGSGDHFEMKICPSVNFLTTQQMKYKHFFVFAAPKFACLRKSTYFCGCNIETQLLCIERNII